MTLRSSSSLYFSAVYSPSGSPIFEEMRCIKNRKFLIPSLLALENTSDTAIRIWIVGTIMVGLYTRKIFQIDFLSES